MRKLALLLSSALIITMLSGCNLISSMIASKEDRKRIEVAEEKTNIMFGEIYDALESRNADILEPLFCKKVAASHNLSKEIEHLFACIEGNVISCDEIDVEIKPYVHTDWRGINNIKTDTGVTYGLRIIHNVDYEDEEYKGIFELKLTKKLKEATQEYCRVGEIYEIYTPKTLPTEYQEYENERQKNSIFVDTHAEIAMPNTALALQNRDVDKLCSLFSEKMQSVELKKQAQAMVDFLDGNIISYKRYDASYHDKNISMGESIHYDGYVKMYNVITDTGKMYEIELYSWFTNKESLKRLDFMP